MDLVLAVVTVGFIVGYWWIWGEQSSEGGGGFGVADIVRDYRDVVFERLRYKVERSEMERVVIERRMDEFCRQWLKYRAKDRDEYLDLLALGMVESGWRWVSGAAGEYGPLQVRDSTRLWLGYPRTKWGWLDAGLEYWRRCVAKAEGEKWLAYHYYRHGLGASG